MQYMMMMMVVAVELTNKHCREVLRFLVYDAWIRIFIPFTYQLCDFDR